MDWVWTNYDWIKSFWIPAGKNSDCKVLEYIKLSEQSRIVSTYCNNQRLLNYHMPESVSLSCKINFQDRVSDIKYVYNIRTCLSKNGTLELGNGMDFSGYGSFRFVVANRQQVSVEILKSLAKDIVFAVRALHQAHKILGPIDETMILIRGNGVRRDPKLFFLSLNHYYKPRNIEHEKLKDMYRIMKIVYDAVGEEKKSEEKKSEEKNPKDDKEFIKWLEHNDIFKLPLSNAIYPLIQHMNDVQYQKLWDLDPLKPFEFEENPVAEEKTEVTVVEEKNRTPPPPKPKGKVKIPNELRNAYDKLPHLTDQQKSDIRMMLKILADVAGDNTKIFALASRETEFKKIGDAIEAKVPLVKIMEFWLSSDDIYNNLKKIRTSNMLWIGAYAPFWKPGFFPKFVKQMNDVSITAPRNTNAQEIIHYFDILTQRINVDISDLKQYLLKSDYDAFITNLLTKNFDASMNVRSHAKSRSGSAETQHSESRSIQLSRSDSGESGSSGLQSISRRRSNSRAPSRFPSRAPSVSQQRSRKQSVSTAVCDALPTAMLECVTQCQNMEDVHYPFRVVMNVEGVQKCYNVQTLYEYQESLPEFKWWRNTPTFRRYQRDFIIQQYTFLHNTLVAHVAKTINYMLLEVKQEVDYLLTYTKESEFVNWKPKVDETKVDEPKEGVAKANPVVKLTQKEMNVNGRKYLKTRLFCQGVPALEINGCGYNNNVSYVGRFSFFDSEFDLSQKTISCAWNKYGDFMHDEIKTLLNGRKVQVDQKGSEWTLIRYDGKSEALYVPFGFRGIATENYRINKKN